jgi:eukaryotic-like serine/threonine-protein kinase
VDSIARVLAAGTVVLGSVQRSGELLRVSYQLVAGATAEPLHDGRVERPRGELLALQDELAERIARDVRRALGTELRLRPPAGRATSAEAWELVQRASQRREEAARLREYGDSVAGLAALAHLRQADSLLARAQRLDGRWPAPGLARGWVAAEAARLLELTTSPVDVARYVARLDDGLRFAEEALRDAPGSAEALELRGTLRYSRSRRLAGPAAAAVVERVAAEADLRALRSAAEADLRAAVAADPTRAGAWATLSELLQLEGAHAEASRAARIALEQDAYLDQADRVMVRLFNSALHLEREGEAWDWCRRGRQEYPRTPAFRSCELQLLAFSEYFPADPTRAWRLLRESLELEAPLMRAERRPYRELEVAAVLARAGLADSARAVIAAADRSAAAVPGVRDRTRYYEAVVRLRLGERDEALDLLVAFLALRPDHNRGYLRADRQLAPLRGDPRFEALLR